MHHRILFLLTIARPVLLYLFLSQIAGCTSLANFFGESCEEMDKRLTNILRGYVEPGEYYLCAEADDCSEGYPVSLESPRSGVCPIYLNKRFLSPLAKYRSDPRVVKIKNDAQERGCSVDEPACMAIRSAGCVEGHCVIRLIGCGGDNCRFDPVKVRRF